MSTPVAAAPPAVAAPVAAAPPQKIVNADKKVKSAVSALEAATSARDKAKVEFDQLEIAVKTAAQAHDDAKAAEEKLLGDLVKIDNNIKSKNEIIKNLNTKTSNANKTKVTAALNAYKAAAQAASDAPNNNSKQQNVGTKLASYKAAKAAAESAGAALAAAGTAAETAKAEKTELETRKAAIDAALTTASPLERSTRETLKAARTAIVEPKRLLDDANAEVTRLEGEKKVANAALKNAQLENNTTKGTSYSNTAGTTSRKTSILGRTITTTDKIIEAAKTGNHTMLEPLLTAITDVATNLPILNRALYVAAEFPSSACVDQLITKGANVTITKDGASILHAAISSLDKYKTNAKLQDKISNVLKIINSVNNANKYVINIKNKNGETVLHLAAKSPLKGSDKIVDTILSFKSDKNYVNTKNTSGKTALQFIHNQNATKINFRGREGRYPINSVNFKKAAALLDKGATVPTGTKGIEAENAEVYPALMKYYKKLNTISGESANIKLIQNKAEEGKVGAKTSFTVPLIGYRKGTANKYDTSALQYTTLAGMETDPIKKKKYTNRAKKYTTIAKSIRNRSSADAEKRAALNIATKTATAARAATNKATAPIVKRSFFNPFGFGSASGGTRKNRSRKNKSTRKNRKH